MPSRKTIRRLAMQVLYQLDLTADPKSGTPSPPTAAELAESLDDEFDSESTRLPAAELAIAAWAIHGEVDEMIATLAPDWPTHRQPPVDRAILRLAAYEIRSGHAPVNVAINEAVELAKAYAAEQSSAFINGILDKLAKQLEGQTPDPMPAPPTKPQADAWLDDAVNG